MTVELVRIGNSRGIRIPKAIIDQCGFGETVDLRVERNLLVIAAERPPREGWAATIRQAVEASEEDQLLLNAVAPNEFDRNEWQW